MYIARPSVEALATLTVYRETKVWEDLLNNPDLSPVIQRAVDQSKKTWSFVTAETTERTEKWINEEFYAVLMKISGPHRKGNVPRTNYLIHWICEERLWGQLLFGVMRGWSMEDIALAVLVRLPVDQMREWDQGELSRQQVELLGALG